MRNVPVVSFYGTSSYIYYFCVSFQVVTGTKPTSCSFNGSKINVAEISHCDAYFNIITTTTDKITLPKVHCCRNYLEGRALIQRNKLPFCILFSLVYKSKITSA